MQLNDVIISFKYLNFNCYTAVQHAHRIMSGFAFGKPKESHADMPRIHWDEHYINYCLNQKNNDRQILVWSRASASTLS